MAIHRVDRAGGNPNPDRSSQRHRRGYAALILLLSLLAACATAPSAPCPGCAPGPSRAAEPDPLGQAARQLSTLERMQRTLERMTGTRRW